jgi:hypothetical protein
MKLLKEPLLHFLIVGGILFGRLTLARRQQIIRQQATSS